MSPILNKSSKRFPALGRRYEYSLVIPVFTFAVIGHDYFVLDLEHLKPL